MSALLTDPYFEADGKRREGKKEEQNHHQDINLGLCIRSSLQTDSWIWWHQFLFILRCCLCYHLCGWVDKTWTRCAAHPMQPFTMQACIQGERRGVLLLVSSRPSPNLIFFHLSPSSLPLSFLRCASCKFLIESWWSSRCSVDGDYDYIFTKFPCTLTR